MDGGVARILAIVVGVLGTFFGSLFAVFQTSPIVPGRIVMATGNATYQALAETYRPDLERNGVTLDLRRDLEGFDTLKALVDPNSGVTAGFVKGGVVGSMQGRLAGAKGQGLASGRTREAAFRRPPHVRTDLGCSRGATAHRKPARPRRQESAGGTRQSGARRLVLQLLRANGLETRTNRQRASRSIRRVASRPGRRSGGRRPRNSSPERRTRRS